MINWGIIGCGKVTEQKSGPAFSRVSGSRLVAVMRRDKALAEDYARRHNIPRFYSDPDQLINDKEVNAVYIVTPPGSHAEYAIRALKAGKPRFANFQIYKAEDFVAASFLFRDNIVGTGIWNFSVSREANRDYFEITGEKGIIKTSTFTYDPIVLVNSAGTQEFVNERPENIQFYLIEQIVRTLSGEGDVVSTGVTAARTSRVLDEVVREYYRGTGLKT